MCMSEPNSCAIYVAQTGLIVKVRIGRKGVQFGQSGAQRLMRTHAWPSDRPVPSHVRAGLRGYGDSALTRLACLMPPSTCGSPSGRDVSIERLSGKPAMSSRRFSSVPRLECSSPVTPSAIHTDPRRIRHAGRACVQAIQTTVATRRVMATGFSYVSMSPNNATTACPSK
jgi:hypothetical protein